MAVYEESEVFQMNPIASVSTKDVINLEGEGLRKFVFEYINSSNTNPQVNISEHDIGVVISHHVSYRPLYKAALLALPNVMAANIVTKAWSRKTGNRGKSIKSQDNRLSGMVSAPILIDGTKYLCGVTLKKSSKRVVPYAIILKDSNGNPVEREKMDGTISNAPHRSNEPTTSGDARLDKAPTSHDTITSSTIENNPTQERFNENQENNGIKDSINPRYNILKENNQINRKNRNKNMNRNKKNVVRLTESKLRNMIKESVNAILAENYGNFTDTDMLLHVQRVVNQIISMFHNNVIKGNGFESFEGWCEDGDVFDWDETEISIMKELSPYVDSLTNKIADLYK